MKKNFNLSYCLGYAAVGIVLFFVCAYQNRLFDQTDAREIFRILSDCFVITGVLAAGVAGVSWAGAQGTFDMLHYGVKSVLFFIPRVRASTEKTFYDYRKKREDRGRRWLPELLVVGLVFLLLGGVCFAVFSFL